MLKPFLFKKILNPLIACVCLCSLSFAQTIVITQIAPHPSLDAIRKGVEDEVQKNIPGTKILHEDAQGNIALASQIAHKIAGLMPDVVVPITTPSAQTVYQALTTHNRSTPMVFAAVSYPLAARLLTVPDQPNGFVTGVADAPPLDKQLALMTAALPHLKKIGVIYNAGEANSVATLADLKNLAENNGVSVLSAAATTIGEISAAAQQLSGQVDAFFVTNDNTIVSSLEAILQQADQTGIPVFASDPESVDRGCIASFSPSQYEIGRQVGRLVVRLLNGESITTVSPEVVCCGTLKVNEAVAQRLGITIPATFDNSEQECHS